MNNAITPYQSDSLPEKMAQLPPEEQAMLEEKLYRLLAKRAHRFSLGENTSLPEETAEEMLRSIRYVLMQQNPTPLALANGNLDTIWNEGIACIEQKKKQAERLIAMAVETFPPLENRSLRETLQSISVFPKKYDYRYFAHQAPCDIDYQLCRPVPETLLGVDYINTYLRRIIIENDFLRRFSSEKLQEFFRRTNPEYEELILNLYEPVAAEAIGSILAGEPGEMLFLSPEGRQHIAEKFRLCHREEMRSALAEAAAHLARQLGLSPTAAEYLHGAALDLSPRILAALHRHTT